MPYADPERRRAVKRESARRVRAARGSTADRGSRPLPLPVRLRCAEDVLHLLSEAVGEVRAVEQASAMDRARVVGYLCGVALRAVEAADVEARLTVLEQRLGLKEETE